MIRTKNIRAGVAAFAIALAAVACSDDPQTQGMTGPGNAVGAQDITYKQVEFLGNPLVSEVTILKAHHDTYNFTQPYNTATFRPETEAFVTSFGRPQALATLLGTLLYPDKLIVDPTKPTNTSGWLSWALVGGWGGRNLTDDVTDIGLSAIFSSLLDPGGALCAPFQLPLCTDNVNSNDKTFSSTFPYLATPHVVY